MTIDPYGRTTKRGVVLNYRTLEMLEITELRALDRLGIVPLALGQGSYSTGVSQSGGTHDGGGAFDVRVRNRLTQSQIDVVVLELRRTGFAAWHRLPSQGDWPEHIHAIAIGDKEMSPAAARQVVAYKNGRNGLANNGPDDGPRVSWTEYRQDIDLSYYGPEKWDADDWKRFRDGVAGVRITDGISVDPDDTIPLDDVLKNDRVRLYETKKVVNDISTTVGQILEKVTVPPA